MEACANPRHKGHRYFTGGRLDGDVHHLTGADPLEFPQTIGAMTLGAALGGPRSWYEIDYDASSGAEVVYRHIGDANSLPGTP